MNASTPSPLLVVGAGIAGVTAALEAAEAGREVVLIDREPTIGGRVLRQLVRHPLLPAEIMDPAPLDDLLMSMKHYDKLGRAAWSRFLAKHDVPHFNLPLDTRDAAGDRPTATH